MRFTRKNDAVKPFEPGGEAPLEFFASKSNCSLFALGAHSKKRPHNLTLGRLFDFRLYDALELGVERHTPIRSFGGAASAQAGNKPAMLFVGERFESAPAFKLAKSLLLDFFRGLEVDAVNLAGLDRVIAVFAAGDTEESLLIRQYRLRYKKGATPRVPRAVLEEMGPALDCVVRRHRAAGADMEKEAMKRPQLTKKKVRLAAAGLCVVLWCVSALAWCVCVCCVMCLCCVVLCCVVLCCVVLCCVALCVTAAGTSAQ